MYAVIKTGGKQYRVQPGDVLVVEKLEGEPGAEVRFDQVLLLGDEAGAVVGAPIVAGASVTATLIETRKGEKIKIFKKTRRQGYRRTRGHRQPETVLRVTGLAGEGKSAAWEGKVDLTPLSVLNLRARNLADRLNSADLTPEGVEALDVVAEVDGPIVHATVVEHSEPEPVAAASVEAAPKKPRAKKAAAPEAPETEATPSEDGEA
jgi:large subunit ribosomal protein L21